MNLINAEYYIKESHNPSYLYKEINWLTEKQNKIQLKMQLTKIEGTLLYTIDKFNSQLIVSLSDDINERIKIEFRSEENYLNLSEFCGCLPCKYKWINLTITVNGDISIQCNNQSNKSFSYSSEIIINKAYPTTKTFNKFQAAIWFVNTPIHNEYYPNNAQLAGCIHEILFNDEPLQMITNNTEITTKCPVTCISNVCNSGVCYETFDTLPICDCTESFLNGPYCNLNVTDVMDLHGKNYPETVQSRFIKITWRADSTYNFGIWNNNISVTILAEGKYIYILFQDRIELFYSNKTITDKYQPNQNTRLYLSFGTKFIEIKFQQNNYTKITKTCVLKDLSEQHFTSISAPKSPAFIDFVYKFSWTEYTWRPLRVKGIDRKDEDVRNGHKGRRNESEAGSGTLVKDVIIGIESSLLIFILIIGLYFVIKRFGKGQNKKTPLDRKEKEALFPNNEEENKESSDSGKGSLKKEDNLKTTLLNQCRIDV